MERAKAFSARDGCPMSIVLQNATKRYEQQIVVNDVSLDVRDGEFFVLLGPSGCGKTTVLNLIAGLVQGEQGRVWLHGQEVTSRPPQDRNVGFVFQHYALFQHMDVASNIEFGLSIRRVPKAERQRRRDELLELVGLVGFANRMPQQLSGGQQQRVALARALALKPDVLLLDEPLGALDAKIRVELRRILKTAQRRLGVAAILVTHDQEEAFDLGDRIGVMSYGRLIEEGTPEDLYQRPKTEFVASFLGTANLLLGQTTDGRINVGGHLFPLPAEAEQLSADGRVQLLFRPEDVALAPTREGLGCESLGQGRVIETGFSGPSERLRLELPAISGVRAIAPEVPFGQPNILIEASRPPDQSERFPLQLGQDAWVGVRRLHALSHPGMSLIILVEGAPASSLALGLGGTLSRMAHARVELLGVGLEEEAMRAYLPEARKQLGSGMASLSVRTRPGSPPEAIADIELGGPHDVLIFGWRPGDGLEIPARLLQAGDHHLLLATGTQTRPERVLLCVSGGEPAKEDVLFSGRLVRHLGSSVTLLTVVDPGAGAAARVAHAERFAQASLQSLSLFGVRAEVRIETGSSPEVIVSALQRERFDLVVLGAPLPDLDGHLSLDGVVGSVIESGLSSSYLIIRSKFHRVRAV
jgi:sulfate transport system ATP-binding protein